MSSNRCLLLNNNIEIPQLALGTYKLEENEIVDVIEKAIDIGYRHFDCAFIYANEQPIGKVFNQLFNKQIIQRSQLFLTSKLWSSFHRFERVRQQCLISINNLQCQYLDLFIIHWPISFIDQVRFHLFKRNSSNFFLFLLLLKGSIESNRSIGIRS